MEGEGRVERERIEARIEESEVKEEERVLFSFWK